MRVSEVMDSLSPEALRRTIRHAAECRAGSLAEVSP